MDQQIVIVYNPITRELTVKENDFSTYEALGVLEAAKAMVVAAWLKENEEAE